MMIIVCCVTLNIILVSGSSFSDQITQTPAQAHYKPEETAEIKCSHTIRNYNNILWYRQTRDQQFQFLGYLIGASSFPESGLGVTLGGSADEGQTCTLTIAGLSLASSAVYYCAASPGQRRYEAYFGSGTKLTVLEPDISVTAPTVTLLRPSPKECRNEKDQKRRKKTLVCLATGFYPDHIDVSWLVNDESVTDGVATDSAAQRPEGKKFYKISSRLRVAAEVWFNPDSVFTCQVSFFNGSGTENFTESIQGEAIVSQDVMTRDSYLKISQAAKLSYSIVVFKSCIYGAFVVFLVWKLQGRTGK